MVIGSSEPAHQAFETVVGPDTTPDPEAGDGLGMGGNGRLERDSGSRVDTEPTAEGMDVELVDPGRKQGPRGEGRGSKTDTKRQQTPRTHGAGSEKRNGKKKTVLGEQPSNPELTTLGKGSDKVEPSREPFDEQTRIHAAARVPRTRNVAYGRGVSRSPPQRARKVHP